MKTRRDKTSFKRVKRLSICHSGEDNSWAERGDKLIHFLHIVMYMHRHHWDMDYRLITYNKRKFYSIRAFLDFGLFRIQAF